MHQSDRVDGLAAVPQWAAGTSIAVGLVVLCGHVLGIQILTRPTAEAGTMKVNAAACFVLAGLALWMLARKWRPAGLPVALASLVAIGGLVTAAQDIFDVDFHIDQALFAAASPDDGPPGRMAPATAMCFLAIGMGLALSVSARYRRWSPLLAILAGLISGMGSLGHLYGAKAMYGIAPYATMAVHTAVVLHMLSAGLLFLQSDLEPARAILARNLSGAMLRRLLPAALTIPIAVGWVRLMGQRAGFYGTELGLALVVLATVVLLSAMVLRNARSIAAAEEKQRHAERQLHELNRSLEQRIDEKVRQLGESEAQLRLVIQEAQDGFVAIDAAGCIVEWNPQAETMFGWKAAEVLGRPVAEIIIPERRRQPHVRGLRRFLETGNGPVLHKRIELDALHRSGKEFPVELTISPVQLNRTWRFNAFIRDLTERRRSEERFRGLLETAPDAMLIIDDEGRIVVVNAQAEKLFGFERGELLNQPIDILMPQRFRQKHHHHRGVYSGDPRVRPMGAGLDLFGIRKDGTEFPIEISLAPLQTEDGMLVSAAIRDITQRKRAEEAQALLAAIVASSEAAIFATTLEGVITTWNAGAERLYGYSPSEILGRPISVLLSAEQFDEITSLIDRVRGGVGVEHFETVRRRKDGVLVHVSVTVSPVKDATGRIIAISTVARDITAAKIAQDALQSSLAEKELLLKEIHHRVKNNMQVVSSLLSLQAESVEDEQVRSSLNQSQARVRAMALLHELLYKSNGLGEIDFAQYVAALWDYVLRTFGRAGERIEFQSEVSIAPLDIDRAVPCGLILTELLSNCVKYAFPDKPGSVAVHIHAMNEAGVRVQVSDNGIGFTEADRTKARQRGSLGLELIDGLCDQLDGVYEWSGPGTVFTMELK